MWITGYTTAGSGIPGLQAGGWVWNSFASSVVPHLTVENTGSEDTSPPSLAGAVISQPSVDVTASGVLVSLTMQCSDDLSGLASAARYMPA